MAPDRLRRSMRSHFPSRGTFLEVVRYLRIATHGVDLGVKRRQVLHRQPARRGGGTPGLSGTRRKFLIGEELSKVGNPIAGSNLVSAWVPYPLAVLTSEHVLQRSRRPTPALVGCGAVDEYIGDSRQR